MVSLVENSSCGKGTGTCVDELRPTKHNPNATPAAKSPEWLFHWGEASREFLPSTCRPIVKISVSEESSNVREL